MDYNINNNKIMENDFNYETLDPSLISRIGRAPVTLSAGRGIAARSAPHTHRASKSSKSQPTAAAAHSPSGRARLKSRVAAAGSLRVTAFAKRG